MKYTVYFDEKYIKEDGDLVTVCNSVPDLNEAKARIGADMMKRDLSESCSYMYIINEEDWDNVDAYGVPESFEMVEWWNEWKKNNVQN